MSHHVYTLGAWRAKPGMEEELVRVWRDDLGAYFLGLERPPGPGTLVQSVEDPQQFYSFGPWESEQDITAMRADPRTPEALRRLAAVCEEAKPGTFRVVARVPDDRG